MNPYLIFILAVIVVAYLIDVWVDLLNVKGLSTEVPKEFEGVYDAKKYRDSQEYLRTNTRFSLLKQTFMLPLLVGFILIGGFNEVDVWARSFGWGELVTGLVFGGALFAMSRIISLPFDIYHTFVIEEKFGFNKTTPGVYIGDLFKGLLLAAVIGGGVFYVVMWFFNATGNQGWLYAWGGLTVLQLFFLFIAPVVIMPIFNKFKPLENEELKVKIEEYAKAQSFKLQGIFTMDGSKRSTKANAFFTGFGKFKRIVLFDTLIEKHSISELVAILAHEIGHYKLKHILRTIVMSIVVTGVMFYFLSLFINNPMMFEAFKMDGVSIYASIIFFSFLYSPVSRLLAVFGSMLSRKHEFEADKYSVDTYGQPEVMIEALKKLSVSNLSNLTPHPWKVFLEYSHPPVMERIRAIRAL